MDFDAVADRVAPVSPVKAVLQCSTGKSLFQTKRQLQSTQVTTLNEKITDVITVKFVLEG